VLWGYGPGTFLAHCVISNGKGLYLNLSCASNGIFSVTPSAGRAPLRLRSEAGFQQSGAGKGLWSPTLATEQSRKDGAPGLGGDLKGGAPAW
jgi:hypothetical protein